MRISVDKRDKGFMYGLDLKNVKVYLDGVLQKDAVTADEELGFVLCYTRDDKGDRAVDLEKKCFIMENKKGKVKIELSDSEGFSIRDCKVKAKFDENHNIVIYVYSGIKKGHIRRSYLYKNLADILSSSEKIGNACAIMAGAAAEYLNENYGDMFDPSEVARKAKEATMGLLADNRLKLVH